MTIFVRPAKASDIPAIAVIRDISWRLHPVSQAQFGPATSEQFQQYVREIFVHRLKDESRRVWVAIQPIDGNKGLENAYNVRERVAERRQSDSEKARKHTHVADGELVGYLCYERKGMGDKMIDDPPNLSYPPTTDHACLHAWKVRKDRLIERWCRSPDRYILGDITGVNPIHQWKGVGTMLCSRAAQEAAEDGMDVLYFTTNPTSYPFYERLAELNGYSIEKLGNDYELSSTLPAVAFMARMQKEERRTALSVESQILDSD